MPVHLLIVLKRSIYLTDARNTEHTKQEQFVVKFRFLVLQMVANTVIIWL